MKTKLKKEAEESGKLLEMRIQVQVMSERAKADRSPNMKFCKCDAFLRMPYLRIAYLSEQWAAMF